MTITDPLQKETDSWSSSAAFKPPLTCGQKTALAVLFGQKRSCWHGSEAYSRGTDPKALRNGPMIPPWRRDGGGRGRRFSFLEPSCLFLVRGREREEKTGKGKAALSDAIVSVCLGSKHRRRQEGTAAKGALILPVAGDCEL